MSHGAPAFSIVVPVYNEVESLDELLLSVDSAMPRGHDYEIVFVDDGSTDGSFRSSRRWLKAGPASGCSPSAAIWANQPRSRAGSSTPPAGGS